MLAISLPTIALPAPTPSLADTANTGAGGEQGQQDSGFTSLLSSQGDSTGAGNTATVTASNDSHPAAPQSKPVTASAPQATPPASAKTSKAPVPAVTPATPATPAAASTADAAAAGADPGQDSVQSANDLNAQLADTLKKISRLVGTLMQATATPAASAATAAVATATVSTTSGANATPADTEAALLQNIQSLLQQLEQTLTPGGNVPANAAATPGSAGTGNNLTAGAAVLPQDLLSTLQSKLTQLVQLLANGQQPGQQTNVNAPFASLLAGLQTATQTAGIATPASISASLPVASAPTQLKDTLAQLQTRLQALTAASTTSAATAAPAVDPLQTLKDALTAKGLTLTTGTNTVANSAATASANGNNYARPAFSLLPAGQGALSAVTDVTANNDNTNTGGNNAGDNSQNQAAPGAVITPAAAQPQTITNGANTSFSQALANAAPQPVAEQVAFQVKAAVDSGSSDIRIRLDPADLGKLDIKLNVGADGKTTVMITADNKNTLNLLQQDTPNLTRALGDAGLKTDSGSLSFSLGGQQQGQQGQAQANPNVWTNYQKAQPDDDAALTVATISRSTTTSANGALDITI